MRRSMMFATLSVIALGPLGAAGVAAAASDLDKSVVVSNTAANPVPTVAEDRQPHGTSGGLVVFWSVMGTLVAAPPATP